MSELPLDSLQSQPPSENTGSLSTDLPGSSGLRITPPPSDLPRQTTSPAIPDNDADVEAPQGPPIPSSSSEPQFYVSIPSLSEEQKALYSSDFGQRPMASEDEFDDPELESVIGEYDDGEQLFYYARFTDGIAYKFPAAKFKVDHPELLEKYEREKEENTLPPFDPSSTYVHPNSRVRLSLHINRKPVKKTRMKRARSNSDELAMSIDSDEFDSEGYVTPPARKSARTAAAGTKKKLPFSPKKTRPITAYFGPATSEFDNSNSEVEEVAAPVRRPIRRSTRTQNKTRINLDDSDYADDGQEVNDDEFDDEYSDEAPKKSKVAKKKKVVRGKASRPAYGRFRVIADMELDEEEDEETAALRAHRRTCEKCHRKPTHELLLDAAKPKKGKRKKNKNSDEEDENDEERLNALGGWVRCLKCPVAAHWGCLARTQRDEILKAALERDRAEWQLANAKDDAPNGENSTEQRLPEPRKRADLDPYQTTEFICGSCMKGGVCMACKQVVIKPDSSLDVNSVENERALARNAHGADTEVPNLPNGASASVLEKDSGENVTGELVFRCITCKRIAHYAHLQLPPDDDRSPDDVSAVELAEYYQTSTHWQCANCVSYMYPVEHILAWRPYPETAIEPTRSVGEPVNHKSMLPREYLVKWADRSYRRTSWVPHGWLLATHTAKLKNFLLYGSRIPLLREAVSEARGEDSDMESSGAFELGRAGEEAGGAAAQANTNEISALSPNPDAQRKIPPAWKTVDRILDVLLWHPENRLDSRKKPQGKGRGKTSARRVDSEDEGEGDDPQQAAVKKELLTVYEMGEQPSDDLTETINEFEHRIGSALSEEHVDRVIWMFVKWDDLGYEDASWDSPPREGEPGYDVFVKAFKRFVSARQISVPLRSSKELKVFDDRPKHAWRKHTFTVDKQPQLGQNPQLKLMPFQVDGVNWLCDNWWNHQHCILADEMGLGKTVQIATFIGNMITNHHAYPALVIVPNSTISNWVREFERWAPGLRVVPFFGEAKAREIIKRYELFHQYQANKTTGAKYHVLVTTYEMITNTKEFTPVFKNTPRWEILVVDEGQRLKSEDSLIFKKLKELNTGHRVIMTGTPLNNNIRELFTLMNFLDPGEWADLDALSKEYEELSEESIKELHGRLKPYFLRRIKSEVLDLPPKNEVIVPVSMAPLQREVYRSILSESLSVLRNLVQSSIGASVSAAVSKANMNNVLMQLRKCLQHPYLVSREIEPKDLSPEETHAKLIDASSKFGLLKMMLPKLRERGHRVLLFSQFSIALDIIEDFLIGEGIKYLRLDGSTKQADRQKGMDEFNRPGSDVFIYLLTTRAGGVGINLWTADTVIIFDPDFNPHQDLQAIARAHRYGQKKTCLVFKLMVKSSAEDKIVQTGKKKLVLDHLIVQKMDDVDGSKEDVQSILMFGAKALFEEGQDAEERQIHYSEHDIDKLIERTEKEGDTAEPSAGPAGTFSFAKVWSADKDALEEIPDEAQEGLDQVDSWAQTLERIAAERTKVQTQEATGRGARRRAAAVFPQQKLDFDDGPDDQKKDSKRKGKGKAKSKAHISDDSDVYAMSGTESDTGTSGRTQSMATDDLVGPDIPSSSLSTFAVQLPRRTPITSSSPTTFRSPMSSRSPPARTNGKTSHPLSPIINTTENTCGLCGTQHGDRPCNMTNSPENLAEYRLMLLLHAGDESLEERRAAIQAIDEALHKRGMIHLIYGQPLHLVEHPTKDSSAPPRKKHKKDVSKTSGSSRISSAVPQKTKQSVITQASAQSLGKVPMDWGNPVASGSAVNHLETVKARPTANGSSGASMNAAAGPSKRSLSPRPGVDPLPKKKKSRDYDPVGCPVCGRSPLHLVKDCPLVAEGPKKVKKAIRRLEGDPTKATTVTVLRSILAKQRRARANTGSAMNISD